MALPVDPYGQQQVQRPARKRTPPQSARDLLAGAVGPAEPDPYDYSTDPVLLRIRGLAEQRSNDARAEATRLLSQLDIEYGVGAAGEANPFSIKAKLKKAREEEPRKLTENLNSQNLFYSSHYGKSQAELANKLLENETEAERAYAQGRSGIEGRLRDRLLGIEEDVIEGEEGASGRLLDRLGDLPVKAPVSPLGGLLGGSRVPTPLGGLLAGAGKPRPRPPRTPRPARRPGQREL